MTLKDPRIAVIGLGYVGLPLAVEFGKRYDVVGFDVDESRVAQLKEGIDHTLEVPSEELVNGGRLDFSTEISAIQQAHVYIVTVPTPIDDQKQPDLRPLTAASRMVAPLLDDGDIVIYESTVYPGATEGVCVPLLEKGSGLKFNEGFFVGYSPERINPGDKEHRLTSIIKVTSGSTPAAAKLVDELYASIIEAGTYQASSIQVAEAAKVIENTQRDVNIALINELAMIFGKLGINTREVLKAAGTKWNFLNFQPGLVGGHCIGVDPYYLTYRAQSVGYHPEVILAGRRLNDGMGAYVVTELVKLMTRKRIHVQASRVLVMGMSFKENCPDIRNTRVIDVVNELREYDVKVDVHDPWIRPEQALSEYDLTLVNELQRGIYDAIIVAVGHTRFREMGVAEIRALGKEHHILYDLKSIFGNEEADLRL